ncbi:hypothetical protein JW930_06045 [Candidatus Woesearchaeota archaeon]|nr:hypothetical protein [Candidatus Woesearchaeota archaeon]
MNKKIFFISGFVFIFAAVLVAVYAGIGYNGEMFETGYFQAGICPEGSNPTCWPVCCDMATYGWTDQPTLDQCTACMAYSFGICQGCNPWDYILGVKPNFRARCRAGELLCRPGYYTICPDCAAQDFEDAAQQNLKEIKERLDNLNFWDEWKRQEQTGGNHYVPPDFVDTDYIGMHWCNLDLNNGNFGIQLWERSDNGGSRPYAPDSDGNPHCFEDYVNLAFDWCGKGTSDVGKQISYVGITNPTCWSYALHCGSGAGGAVNWWDLNRREDFTDSGSIFYNPIAPDSNLCDAESVQYWLDHISQYPYPINTQYTNYRWFAVNNPNYGPFSYWGFGDTSTGDTYSQFACRCQEGYTGGKLVNEYSFLHPNPPSSQEDYMLMYCTRVKGGSDNNPNIHFQTGCLVAKYEHMPSQDYYYQIVGCRDDTECPDPDDFGGGGSSTTTTTTPLCCGESCGGNGHVCVTGCTGKSCDEVYQETCPDGSTRNCYKEGTCECEAAGGSGPCCPWSHCDDCPEGGTTPPSTPTTTTPPSIPTTMPPSVTTTTQPSGGGGGGCPSLYYKTKKGYVYAEDISLGQFSELMVSGYYTKLNGLSEPSVKLTEFFDETYYLDEIKLIEVQTTVPITEILQDNNGISHTIQELTPVECVDSSGTDCTSLIKTIDTELKRYMVQIPEAKIISEEDYGKHAYTSKIADVEDSPRDYLEISLPESQSIIKLVVSLSETGQLNFAEADLFGSSSFDISTVVGLMKMPVIGDKIISKIQRASSLKTMIKDSNGNWIDYPDKELTQFVVGTYKTIVIPLDSSLLKDNKIRLEFWRGAYAFDYIGADTSVDLPMEVKSYKPTKAVKEGQDFTQQLLEKDNNYAEVSFNEELVVEFPTEIDQDATYFLEAQGYYLTNMEPGETGGQDLMQTLKASVLLTRLIFEENYAERYFLERYLEN